MFLHNASSPLSLICDIGSATVSLAVVDRSKKVPEIVYTTRVPMNVLETFDHGDLEKALISFFSESLKNIQSAFTAELSSYTTKHIHNAYLIFSSPWYVTKISTVVIQKQEPFLLDERSVEEIVIEEEKKFEHEVLTGAYTNIRGKDLHVIERELVRVKLNGYETASPYLKKTTQADLSIAMSLVPQNLLVALVTALSTTLHVSRTKSFTFPLVSFGAMRTVFPTDTDFLFVDVAGEMTDISFVEDDIIVGAHSMPLARNTLVRAVSDSLAVSSEVALSHLALFSSGSLEDSISSKLQGVLDEYFAKWLAGFESAPMVVEAKNKEITKIFTTTHEDVSAIFTAQFKKPELARFQIIPVTDSSLDTFVSYAKHVAHDPFLSLETIFLEDKFL